MDEYNKEEKYSEPNKKHKKWWRNLLITIFVLFLSFLTSLIFYVTYQVKNILEEGTNASYYMDSDKVYNAEGDSYNFAIGSENPKVKIIVFEDFSCPHCRKFYKTLQKTNFIYHDDVKIIFRNFTSVNEQSINYALAAQCSGEQNMFILMHDTIFQKQEDEGFADVYTVAEQIGLDTEKFRQCIEKKKYMPRIRKDYVDGQKLGIQGTPTAFINGHKISGNIPYDDFKKVIEYFLNNSDNKN